MGINTQGIMSLEVKKEDIVKILQNKFKVDTKLVTTSSKNYYTAYFNYNGESRMLSIFENYTDYQHTGKDKLTLIDLNYWGSSVELIRGIVEEFGGQMVEDDCGGEWEDVELVRR